MIVAPANTGFRRGTLGIVAGLSLLLSIDAWCADDAVDAAWNALNRQDRNAAIQILASRVESEPGDQEARFLFARALAWNGRTAESLAQYDELLFADPDNADYLLGQAQVYYWDDQEARALPLLARARELAPDYEAVWQLEARALLAMGDTDSEARFGELTRQARQRFPDTRWPVWPQLTPRPLSLPVLPATRGYVEAGGEYQDLDHGLPSWTSLYLNGSYRPTATRTVYGQLRQTDRFNNKDRELQAGLVLPALTSAMLTLEGTGAPGADVLPRWSVYSALHLPLPQGYGVGAGWRHRSYNDEYLNIVTLTGERYIGNYYAAWTLYISKLENADTNFANQLRLDRYYKGESRIGLLIAAGKETESVGSGRFVESDTLSLALTGLHKLSPSWAVNWDLIYHDQDDAYARGGFRVGLRRQF